MGWPEFTILDYWETEPCNHCVDIAKDLLGIFSDSAGVHCSTAKRDIVQSMFANQRLELLSSAQKKTLKRKYKNKRIIIILSVCQAALNTLKSTEIKSKLAGDCITTLNRLETDNKVSLLMSCWPTTILWPHSQ